MIPFLVANVTSSVELQKNITLSSLKGMTEGIKLKLQILAMAMAVASMPFRGSIQSQMTAFFQLSSSCLTPDIRLIVFLGSGHCLSL